MREDGDLYKSVVLLMIFNKKKLIFAPHVCCCFPLFDFDFGLDMRLSSSVLVSAEVISFHLDPCGLVSSARRQLSVPRVVSASFRYSLAHVCLQGRSRPAWICSACCDF
jgi:hypothetical protein